MILKRAIQMVVVLFVASVSYYVGYLTHDVAPERPKLLRQALESQRGPLAERARLGRLRMSPGWLPDRLLESATSLRTEADSLYEEADRLDHRVEPLRQLQADLDAPQ